MLELGRPTSEGGRDARGGADHPYVVNRAINLAHDLRAVGEEEEADALFADSLAKLRTALGNDHPDVLAAEEGLRTEGDIEPPPT
jgi:hypothetical protein